MSEVKKENWGAWKKTTKDGKEVINFAINGKRYNMWVNSYKTEAKQPDYKIYEDTYVAPTGANNAPVNVPIQSSEDNNDLPF
jgi:hypothetical protein